MLNIITGKSGKKRAFREYHKIIIIRYLYIYEIDFF